MPRYSLRIRQGESSRDHPVDLPDDDAVWHEAAKICRDLIRDAVDDLRDSPVWRLEVVNESGTVRHLFRLTTETFDH